MEARLPTTSKQQRRLEGKDCYDFRTLSCCKCPSQNSILPTVGVGRISALVMVSVVNVIVTTPFVRDPNRIPIWGDGLQTSL